MKPRASAARGFFFFFFFTTGASARERACIAAHADWKRVESERDSATSVYVSQLNTPKAWKVEQSWKDSGVGPPRTS